MELPSLVATHEVADCQRTDIVARTEAEWEKCIILRTTRTGHDVQIVSDRDIYKDVPKRFVRPLKTSKPKKRKRRSYKWTPAELKLFEEAKKARVEAIRQGKIVSQRQPNVFFRDFLLLRDVDKRLFNPALNTLPSLTPIVSPIPHYSLRQITKMCKKQNATATEAATEETTTPSSSHNEFVWSPALNEKTLMRLGLGLKS